MYAAVNTKLKQWYFSRDWRFSVIYYTLYTRST